MARVDEDFKQRVMDHNTVKGNLAALERKGQVSLLPSSARAQPPLTSSMSRPPSFPVTSPVLSPWETKRYG